MCVLCITMAADHNVVLEMLGAKRFSRLCIAQQLLYLICDIVQCQPLPDKDIAIEMPETFG